VTRSDAFFEGIAVSLLGVLGLIDTLENPVESVALLRSAALLGWVDGQAVLEPVLDDDLAVGTLLPGFLNYRMD
jgi:hypothetical protein